MSVSACGILDDASEPECGHIIAIENTTSTTITVSVDGTQTSQVGVGETLDVGTNLTNGSHKVEITSSSGEDWSEFLDTEASEPTRYTYSYEGGALPSLNQKSAATYSCGEGTSSNNPQNNDSNATNNQQDGTEPEDTDQACDDGIDNDGDGQTDCDDDDCSDDFAIQVCFPDPPQFMCVDGCQNQSCPGTYEFCARQHGACAEVPCQNDSDCCDLWVCDDSSDDPSWSTFYCDSGRCRRGPSSATCRVGTNVGDPCEADSGVLSYGYDNGCAIKKVKDGSPLLCNGTLDICTTTCSNDGDCPGTTACRTDGGTMKYCQP